MAYVTLAVEGGLFPADLLDRVALGELPGQRPADFGPDAGARLSDDIQAAFSDMCAYREAFEHRRARERESSTTLTREFWIIPFLESLGFRLAYQRAAAQVGDESYAISHRAGDGPDAPPVHIVAFDQPLDGKAPGARRSPHALVQEYLNRSDCLWGLVTNGEHLRLLRASARLAGPAYLDIDLAAMVEGNQYNEFVLLYRLLHRSRFPQPGAGAHECLLERYYQQGLAEGGRVREHLRDGVEAALKELGSAFLAHPASAALRADLAAGRLDAAHYYRQLLRLVYRLLFLFVAEERRLIFPPAAANAERQAIYTAFYSATRLRERAERYFADDRHADLWLGLLETFRLFRDDGAAKQLGLAALDGELFGADACRDIETASCENARLLAAVRALSTFADRRVRRRVNYAALDVEELGSVYESLLDYRPYVELDPAPRFDLLAGGERKQTGSYYTPPELVRELIKSALEPVMAERLAAAKTKEDQVAALLALRVCDPASGSGHFLLAAARRIGRELARIRSGEEEPPPAAYRAAVRDVIRHCLYAVDKNPLAVDLCKVALWLEGHNAGLPLSFLDHHVKCGDSLVGVFDLKVLKEGIPDEAYTPVTGDDKQAAAYYRKRNKAEREGQHSLDGYAATPAELINLHTKLAQEFESLAALEERTAEDVRRQHEQYQALRGRPEWQGLKVACNLFTAPFFQPLRRPVGNYVELLPTTEVVWRFMATPAATSAQLLAEVEALANRLGFFHWSLEFIDVIGSGGFDAIVGNPPFGNAIEAKTGRDKRDARYFAWAYPEVAQGAYDRANLFFGRAVQILSGGGGLGMVCPRATASGKGSAGLRRYMDARMPPHLLWCPESHRLFQGASVFVCLVAARASDRPPRVRVSTDANLVGTMFREVALPPGGSGKTWWEVINSRGDGPDLGLTDVVTLGETAMVWAGCTTGVAYKLAAEVEDAACGAGLRLITTGAIDRFKLRWGQMKIRFLRRDYAYPRWPAGRTNRHITVAKTRQQRPKILIAGLSKVIEAALDAEGSAGGVVSTFVVEPRADDGDAFFSLLAVLNSATFSFLFLQRFGAKQMSGGNCTVGKEELLSIPVPRGLMHAAARTKPRGLWQEAISLARELHVAEEGSDWDETDDRLHAVVAELYGLTHAQHERVFSWWSQRRARKE